MVGSMLVLFFYFFEEFPNCFPQLLYKFTFPPTVHQCSPFSKSSPILVSYLSDNSHLICVRLYVTVVLIYSCLMMNVLMWELECEESWVLKNWCFWTVVLEKTLESPLDCKEIQPVHRKGDQSWVFTGRTDAEAETPVLWPPHGKGWLVGKDPDAGRNWRQEKMGTIEDEMAGWHHQLDRHEFE